MLKKVRWLLCLVVVLIIAYFLVPEVAVVIDRWVNVDAVKEDVGDVVEDTLDYIDSHQSNIDDIMDILEGSK